jgi:alanyl aminopeptidase
VDLTLSPESESPDGAKIVRFAETAPLPIYLMAFGVGPFDFAPGPAVGCRHVPFRVVVPNGQAGAAACAVRSTPDLVALLEKYFGTPYPYDKHVLPAPRPFHARGGAT